jgi:ABC-type oligopeptide transport system ATPase subunit
MNEPVIAVSELTRRFGSKLALDAVSLTVPRGGVYGLVGANGAGKTTLIKHLLGLLRAEAGSVRLFGLDPVADPVAVLSRIGYLSEENDLPGWMRVDELIATPARSIRAGMMPTRKSCGRRLRFERRRGRDPPRVHRLRRAGRALHHPRRRPLLARRRAAPGMVRRPDHAQHRRDPGDVALFRIAKTRGNGGRISTTMIERLDRLHAWLRTNPLAWRLVIGTRILLCAGFLPTGMVKLMGQPFTIIDVRTPLGLFFHAMHQTGLYWRFLGATQVVASLVLLIPRTAHLGGLLFFPIILNIFVITISMEFKGTPVLTALMLLASLLLVAWDYHRWRSLLTTKASTVAVPEPLPLSPFERIGYAMGAVFGLLFFLSTRSLVPKVVAMPSLMAAGFAVFLVLALAAGRPWRRALTSR